jgi:hypothetical protein
VCNRAELGDVVLCAYFEDIDDELPTIRPELRRPVLLFASHGSAPHPRSRRAAPYTLSLIQFPITGSE